MPIIITGGAGFIGSNIVSHFNMKGINDILIVDNLGDSGSPKWKNLVDLKFKDYIHKDTFLDYFKHSTRADEYTVIHCGACSTTTETNYNYLMENNYKYSQRLYDICRNKMFYMINLSSASTYGLGPFDDTVPLEKLRPLNMYGYSKHLFDLYASQYKFDRMTSLKLFNVFGPRESHKSNMVSVVYKFMKEMFLHQNITLFKSAHPLIKDGQQSRDFISVHDVVHVIDWFFQNQITGVYNLGTGVSTPYIDIANTVRDCYHSLFKSSHRNSDFLWIDTPQNLKAQYQHFTRAELKKLRQVGCMYNFASSNYIQEYCSILKSEFMNVNLQGDFL